MTRKSYVQIGGKLYDKAELSAQESGSSAPAIRGDIPDFVSSIDGSLVSGRAGLREHCRKHNVVPTADLAGLPPKPFVNTNFDQGYRDDTKRTMAEIINSRNYKG